MNASPTDGSNVPGADARAYAGGREIPALQILELTRAEPSRPERLAIEMITNPNTHNAVGAVHGGVLAMLMDHTGGVAASELAGKGGPTADLHIRYLRPALTEKIRAEAWIVKAGGRLVVVGIEVFDTGGKLVASGDMTVAVGTRKPGSQFPD